MANTRTVEVFTADCPLCSEVVTLVQDLACDSCEVHAVSLQEDDGQKRAREVGVETVPAVAVNGTLADCCRGGGVDEDMLRAAGVGQSL
ncbi:thioredoxin family protein [Salinibacter sp.]|uniref:thioredoxin family protein n=1 Tax=Salinibacter sp. TaxID=2065818 RepID=UPI0021E9225B|nr:thioredoxin family protein [Salinibacter sp.]